MKYNDNFVLHAVDWLEGGLCTGYEKLVLDADRLGAYQVMLYGLPVDEALLEYIAKRKNEIPDAWY